MKVEYSHGIIDSPDLYNQSIEELLYGTKADCKPSSKEFESYGEGILCEDFFMGRVNTNHVKEIVVENLNSYVLTVPIDGEFRVDTSDRKTKNIIEKSGSLSMPTDKVLYNSESDFIKDYEVFINPDVINPILEKKFNVSNLNSELLILDVKTEKVKAITQFIDSTIVVMSNFPDAQNSMSFKNNIQEIISFLLVDLIAEKINAKPVTNNSPEENLVKLAEEFIDANCVTIFNINQIADRLFTTPRNIQIAFKKHRNYSPMAFVKSRKLHKAHKLILANIDNKCTVKEIAISVGMYDLNRFSKYYREIFRELPSETLKKTW